MSGIIWFLLGALVGFLISWVRSWMIDKFNLLKLGYSGGSFIVKWIYNRFIKK